MEGPMADIDTYVTETLQYVREKLGLEAWFTAYQWKTTSDESDTALLWCQLIPESEQSRALAAPDQLQEPTFGQPGFVLFGDERRPSYFQFGDDTDDEPLVIRRDYHGLEPETLDISQEFCLYHNLYRESDGNYVRFNDAGNKEPVVRYEPDGRVLIRTLELKQYLAAKSMVLVVHFDFERKFMSSSNTVDAKPVDKVQRETDSIIQLVINPLRSDSKTTIAMIYGNKIIQGCALEECGQYPYESVPQHESFEVGVNASGHPILKEADTNDLSIGEFVTPVFFTTEVLVKYRNNPDKYQIEDGFMHCAGLWSLRLDNDRSDYVVVLLGDLGLLPASEQKYWRSFNVAPDGTWSTTAATRGVLGQFADPTSPDLVFKQEYRRFREDWQQRYDWDLLRPLPAGDQHCLGGLTIPPTDSQHEFDTQVQGLTKVLVESLNDKELAKHVTSPMEQDAKSITKLNLFLKDQCIHDYEPQIEYLRNLQDLRSKGSAHLKGTDYEKTLAKFGGGPDVSRQTTFRTVLTQAVDFLRFMTTSLLSGEEIN